MRRISFAHTVLALGIASCSARTETHSDAGHELAQRLCAVQSNCNCADELIIPACEERVEREFAENERKALNAGLVYHPSCMEDLLEYIDAVGTCESVYPGYGPLCPVYSADVDVGEPCEVFDMFPEMVSCRFGLGCGDGLCRDNPILPLGAICSEEQADVPTGWLGHCGEGLHCDSQDTRTCVPVTPIPQALLGEECVHYYGCIDGNICRPQGDDPEPSEDRPGACVERTPPGERCTLVYECDRICENGFCQVPPPAVCEALRSWWELRELF